MLLNEEYLVMPTISMIGAVGGNLGLFIGFSFFDFFCTLLDYSKILLIKLAGNEILFKPIFRETYMIFIFCSGKRITTLNMKVVDRIYKLIELSMLLTLGILGVLSTEGTIDAYSVKKTSLGYEEVPLTEQPTFTLCFGLSHLVGNDHRYFKYLRLGIDFNISFSFNSERYICRVPLY